MFGSLSPVWTRLGLHAQDNSDPERAEGRPRLRAARTPRATASKRPGTRWACAPTRSDDTILDGVFVPDRVHRANRAGGHLDQFLLALFAMLWLNFGAIYYAIAERARDLAIASARKTTSLALTRSMAYHPEIQHLFAEMQLEIEAMGPQLEQRRRTTGRPASIMGGVADEDRCRSSITCAEGAKQVVDLAMTSTGGGGHVQAQASWSGCTATCAAAASTRPTRC